MFESSAIFYSEANMNVRRISFVYGSPTRRAQLMAGHATIVLVDFLAAQRPFLCGYFTSFVKVPALLFVLSLSTYNYSNNNEGNFT